MEFLRAHAALARSVATVSFAVAAAMLTRSAEPVRLAVPGRANANVSIAADGDLVAVAWGSAVPGGATDIHAAVSIDGGATFGAPVRVNDTSGDARVNGEQAPRIAVRRTGPLPGRAPSADIAVSWMSSREGTTVRVAKSTDGARTFGRSVAVSKPGAPGARGWHGMSGFDARGDVAIVWLDHRDMAARASGSAHAAHQMEASTHGTQDGAVMAQRSSLFVASLTAAGPSAERRVTAGVCYCCKTAVVSASDGALYAAWRHVYPGNIRDVAFTASRDGGRSFASPIRVSEDKWALDGCPDDGPAMAVGADQRAHIVWPTLVAEGEPTIALFYATSRDGKTFTARERIPTEGLPHHPQIAIAPDGSLAVTWDELQNGTRRVVVAQRSLVAKAGTWARQIVGADAPAMYPVVAAVPNGFAVAWTSGAGSPASVIRVARVSRNGAPPAATRP